MQYSRNRLALALLALAVTLPDASALAATCRSKMDDYNSEATQQVAKAKQLGPNVFTPLQQKKCTAGAQAFLDSYILLLKRLVALRAAAYPCNDSTGRNQPIPGTPPEKILGEAQDLRVLCQAYLNAPQKEADRKPPDGGGEGSCSDITGLGGPRIKCPERKLGPASAMAQPKPQAQRSGASSDPGQAQRQAGAINDVLGQLGGDQIVQQTAPGTVANAPSARPRGSIDLTPAGYGDLLRNSARRCNNLAYGSEDRKRCLLIQQALLIMDADPAIKAACGAHRDEAERSNCALQAYARQLAAFQAARSDRTNCYYDINYQPCFPGGINAPRVGPAGEPLRERIRRRLAKERADNNDPRPVTDQEIDAAAAAETSAPSAAVDAGQQPDPDNPLRDYLLSENAGNAGNNAGNLGPLAPRDSIDAQAFRERFGIDPPQEERTIFEQVRRRYQREQERGNVGR